MTKKPSFVLFITDQHRADYLGCSGHPTLKTPHIDALAAAGVRHTNFLVNSPVCMPNRASLMTCRHPSSHGVWTNGTPLSQRHVTFVELLRAAGYDTALIGKSHLQNFAPAPPHVQQPEAPAGFTPTPKGLSAAERPDGGDYLQEAPQSWAKPGNPMTLPFYGFDHVDLVTGHGDGAGGAYKRWLRNQRPDADDLIGEDNEIPHDYVVPQAVRTKVPEELYTTSWITDRALDWIASLSDPDKPFFLMISWPDPHHPWNPPGKYWDMYKPEDMDVPEAFNRDDWQPPFYVKGAMAMREAGKAMTGGFGTFACSAREAQEARALTCGMIAMIDEGVGKVTARLDAEGLTQNTVRIFTSDHGDHLGDHKLLLKGVEMYDQIVRVPFIWSDPSGETGTVETGIGQTFDIGTSILARARLQTASGMQGQPLPVTGGTPREAALIQFDNQLGNPELGDMPRVHTLRKGRYRMSVFHDIGGGELYDLEADPGEFVNLWDEPSSFAIKAECLEKMLRLEIASTDRLPLPAGMA